ncbi:MAG TPA: DNA topology modulation protein [Pyrinomonadaceae bacterium]|nr:DNA topology modulation protein [Pyrinomonadaceae bacterium]
MKKIIIIGSGGAGKSTFARELGKLLKIEVLHLDKLYWKPNWVEPPKDEWKKLLEKELQKDEWIMDGNFGGTLEMRLNYCDTVIFLELPRVVCLYRTFKRWTKYWNTNRPDMTVGCNEKFDLEFLGWIWNFPKTKKPKIDELLKRFEHEKTIIRLHSAKEVKQFLEKLKAKEN